MICLDSLALKHVMALTHNVDVVFKADLGNYNNQ